MHICKWDQRWDVILLVGLQNAIQLENNVLAYHYVQRYRAILQRREKEDMGRTEQEIHVIGVYLNSSVILAIM